MKAITSIFALGAGAMLAAAAPAAAQYFPGYGYGSPYARPNSQMVINECTNAVQSRLSGGYGYGGPRVLGISQVSPRADGGITVRGVASSGRYAGYGYGPQRPDLSWRCRTNAVGYILQITINPAEPAYGGDYGYTPWNDYSQYGYHR